MKKYEHQTKIKRKKLGQDLKEKNGSNKDERAQK